MALFCVHRDFLCQRATLVAEMGYFRTLLSKFRDVEVVVHCEIGIFEWLTHYISNKQYGTADSMLDKLGFYLFCCYLKSLLRPWYTTFCANFV